MRLKISQYKLLSNFCNDIAKGVMLAGLLGQGVFSLPTLTTRIVVSTFAFLFAFVMLYFAIYFRGLKQ